MKSVYVILIIFFITAITNYNCEKGEPPNQQDQQDPLATQPKEVQDFLNSPEFAKNDSLFFCYYGKIGIGKVITLKNAGETSSYIMIPIFSNDTTISAYIQVAKLPYGNLPNDEIYAMNFINLRGFSMGNLSGHVQMNDLNYDGFLHSEMYVVENVISSWESLSVPDDIRLKYHLDSTKGYFDGFFYCYRKMREWQNSFDALYFICDWATISCAAAASSWCLTTYTT